MEGTLILIYEEEPDWEGSCPFNLRDAIVNRLLPEKFIYAELRCQFLHSFAGTI